MAGQEQGTLPDGTQYTIGTCDDGRWAGKKFVSLGTRHNHTTFIVDSEYANVYAVKSRGSDKDAWRRVALAVTQGYWD